MMLFCHMPWEFFVGKASYQNKWNLSTNYGNLLITPNLRPQRQKVWRNPGREHGSFNMRCYDFLFYDLLVAPLEFSRPIVNRCRKKVVCVLFNRSDGFYWGWEESLFSFIINLETSKAPTPPPAASLLFLSPCASQSCLFFSSLQMRWSNNTTIDSRN